jgi:hypothetical protein
MLRIVHGLVPRVCNWDPVGLAAIQKIPAPIVRLADDEAPRGTNCTDIGPNVCTGTCWPVPVVDSTEKHDWHCTDDGGYGLIGPLSAEQDLASPLCKDALYF